MVEVIEEMTDVLAEYRSKACTMTDDELITRIIELHEANKPKPEPVGYVKTVGGYPDESEHKVEWVVKHKELKDSQALYTTPLTREPLSVDEMPINGTLCVNGIMLSLDCNTAFILGVRFAEHKHGIGATNDQPQAIPTR